MPWSSASVEAGFAFEGFWANGFWGLWYGMPEPPYRSDVGVLGKVILISGFCGLQFSDSS